MLLVLSTQLKKKTATGEEKYEIDETSAQETFLPSEWPQHFVCMWRDEAEV